MGTGAPDAARVPTEATHASGTPAAHVQECAASCRQGADARHVTATAHGGDGLGGGDGLWAAAIGWVAKTTAGRRRGPAAATTATGWAAAAAAMAATGRAATGQTDNSFRRLSHAEALVLAGTHAIRASHRAYHRT